MTRLGMQPSEIDQADWKFVLRMLEFDGCVRTGRAEAAQDA